MRHPSILPLLGIDGKTCPKFCCLVFPRAAHGNVRECFETLTARGRIVPKDRWVSVLCPRYGLRLTTVSQTLEVAEGLSYLHKVGVPHGALRGVSSKTSLSVRSKNPKLMFSQTNVLINRSYSVMLSDFDYRLHYVTECWRAAISSPRDPDVTPRWYAPEILDPVFCHPEGSMPEEKLDFLEVCRQLATSFADVYAFGCVCLEVRSQILCK